MFQQILFLSIASSQIIHYPLAPILSSQVANLTQKNLIVDEMPYGWEASGGKVFGSFSTEEGMVHQNLLDPDERYVDKSGLSGKGLLFVNRTFAYSTVLLTNNVVSVILDPKSKTVESKVICEFPAYEGENKFSDMALSNSGDLFISVNHHTKRGIKGQVYKCSPQGKEHVLKDFGERISALVAQDSHLTILSSIEVDGKRINSTISNVSLKDNTIEKLAVKDIGVSTKSFFLRKCGDHLYAL